MSEVKVGEVIKGEAHRDAIHVAVLPVIVAADYMYPGETCEFVYGTTDQIKQANDARKSIGIVDPFLTVTLKKGDRCYLWMKPGTVTGMRHHWQHPAVDEPKVAEDISELWLRQFAQHWNFDYDEMVRLAQVPGEYITANGVDLHSREELSKATDGTLTEDLFWGHLGNVTGKIFNQAHRSSIGWSCSC